MTEDKKSEKLDYDKLGFKAGLEIHQQLDTHKLFCNCPSVIRQDEPDYTVSRRLHAVAGESGEVDVAARHEAEVGREFVYEVYRGNDCLVDLDEAPPYEINQEALKIAVQISLLLNAKIIPITQIMRKTVIDGSNTTGFQRTTMIARDGWIETSYGKVGIQGIYLEEDSARHVKKEGNKVFFRLDRLGIPLMEITTDASMKNPEQVKEAALHIGNILRSSKVRRGIGTIRQDLNLSIKKGARAELKGFQEPRIMMKVIDNEVRRQLALIEAGKAVKTEVRNVMPDATSEYLRPMPDSARMYPETDLPILKISRGFIDEAKKSLPKLRTEIGEELKAHGLNEEMIKLLLKENKVDEFKELLNVVNSPSLIVKMILIFPKEIASHEKKTLEEVNELLNKDVLIEILGALSKKKISEAQIKEVMTRTAKGESFEKAIEFKKEGENRVEEKIMRFIKEKPGLSVNAYMGLVMKDPELRGAVDGKRAMEMIKRYVK